MTRSHREDWSSSIRTGCSPNTPSNWMPQAAAWKLKGRQPSLTPVKLGDTSLDGNVQILRYGLATGDEVVIHSEHDLNRARASRWLTNLWANQVISPGRAGHPALPGQVRKCDRHPGLGLLISVTLTMAGVYRGMVDDDAKGVAVLRCRYLGEFTTGDAKGLARNRRVCATYIVPLALPGFPVRPMSPI